VVNVIRCNRCGNMKQFAEVHVGGTRKHEWTQQANGRMVYERAVYDKVEDTYFECGKCGNSLNDKYRSFLQAIFQFYDEKIHGI
jgi:hypothetical protein